MSGRRNATLVELSTIWPLSEVATLLGRHTVLVFTDTQRCNCTGNGCSVQLMFKLELEKKVHMLQIKMPVTDDWLLSMKCFRHHYTCVYFPFSFSQWVFLLYCIVIGCAPLAVIIVLLNQVQSFWTNLFLTEVKYRSHVRIKTTVGQILMFELKEVS